MSVGRKLTIGVRLGFDLRAVELIEGLIVAERDLLADVKAPWLVSHRQDKVPGALHIDLASGVRLVAQHDIRIDKTVFKAKLLLKREP